MSPYRSIATTSIELSKKKRSIFKTLYWRFQLANKGKWKQRNLRCHFCNKIRHIIRSSFDIYNIGFDMHICTQSQIASLEKNLEKQEREISKLKDLIIYINS